MTVRFYSSTAVATSLNGAIAAGATAINVNDTTGFPTNFPYVLSLDYGGAAEELVDVTAAAGLSLTVTRGVDGTSAQSHGNGAVVRHVASGRDFSDSRSHENASTNVHGLSGGAAVVGDISSQTLTNKTLTSPTINTATISNPTMTGGGSLSGTYSGTPTFSGNYTSSANPIFSGQPQITDFSNATHDHSAANKGGSTLKVITVSDTNTTDVPLNVNAVVGQTGNLAQFQVNGTTLARISSSGSLVVVPTSTSATLALLDAPTGQTSNLINARVNAVSQFSVSAGGDISNLGIGQLQFARKTATQSVTSSTVNVDCTDLGLSVASNATYKVEVFTIVDGAAAGDIKWGWTFPATGTFNWTMGGLGQGATTEDNATVRQGVGVGTASVGYGTVAAGTSTASYGSGIYRSGATAGTLQLQFSQTTSSATATRVFLDSWISLIRVA